MVRTLADRPRLLSLRDTTITYLIGRPRPRRLSARRMAFERHIFRVTAAVTSIRPTAGGLHLVVGTGAAHMIVAVPLSACTTRAAPYRRRQMAQARGVARLCKSAAVTGVAFFSPRRGEAGAAANAIELQPILGFRCQSTAPPPDPVVVAAGDIACDPDDSSFNGGNGTSEECRQRWTANVVAGIGPTAVLPLGDNQYYCGGYSAFLQAYDPTWGAFKSITRPSLGNHEYLTSGGTDCNAGNAGANGYFTYFGAAAGQRGQGYYSYDLGAWHLIALNSNCGDAGGCSESSPQGQWLAADLAAHQNVCTLAYWHIPLFSSGGRANGNTRTFWQLLYDNAADVILSAHDHDYERFAPQTPDGDLDTAHGIREFIVGTGGANHTSFVTTAANSQVRNDDTFGVLKLTLQPSGYTWQFVPEAGQAFTDSGAAACH